MIGSVALVKGLKSIWCRREGLNQLSNLTSITRMETCMKILSSKKRHKLIWQVIDLELKEKIT